MSIETSPTIGALAKAMLHFQGITDGVKRDAANPHFKTRYASLESAIDYARPSLQASGLIFTQAPGAMVDGALEVTTRIIHAESGEWQQSTMQIPLAKRDPQSAGAALTYGMRYSFMAVLGLPPTDDDAESSYDRSPAPQRQPERPQPQPAANDALPDDRQKTIAESLIGAMEYSRTVEDLQAWKKDEAKNIMLLTGAHIKRVGAAFKAREAALLAGAPQYREAGE